MEAERTLDDARLALNRFFNGEGPERWVFTLNCTDALNMAIKGTVQPGDHVITSDLEHNSVSRPLRRLEKDGRDHAHPARLPRRLSRPRRRPQGPDAEDPAGRPDPRRERPRHRAADRGDRADRPRGRGPVPRRRGAVGRRRADRPAKDARSTCWRSPATSRSTARPAPAPSTSAPGRVRPPALARRGDRGRLEDRGRSPTSCPTSSKGGRPTSSASPASPPASPGSRSAGRRPTADTRSTCSSASSTGSRARPTAGRSPAAGTRRRTSGRSRWSSPTPGTSSTRKTSPRASTVSFGIAVRPGLHCAPYCHRRLGTFPDGTIRLSPGPFNTADDIDAFLDALSEITAGVL